MLWSARFDEALADLFSLQDKITTQIAGALAIRVTQIEQRRVFAKPTENLEAYDYVLRARPALQRPTRANIVEARALPQTRHRARSELRRRLCGTRRNLSRRRIDGLGGVADGIPEPRGGNGEQGAEYQRLRSACTHRSRPHPYLLSPI